MLEFSFILVFNILNFNFSEMVYPNSQLFKYVINCIYILYNCFIFYLKIKAVQIINLYIQESD